MRVLVTTPAGAGHVHPMVPLARALVARGHEVLWGLPDRAVVTVEQAGLSAVGTSQLGPTSPSDVIARYPEINDLPPAKKPTLIFAKLFGELLAPSMLAGLLPVARDFQPDLVVSDAAELAGPIVAASQGVPGVIKGFGPLLAEERVARVEPELEPLWRSCGLEPRPYGGGYDHLYLDPYPPGLQPASVAHVPRRQLLRPVSYTGPVSSGVPLPVSRADRPLVYVTMGTVFSNPGLLTDVVTSLAGLDVRVLVTVGPTGDPAALGPQPAHVRVERYVPQDAVLPLTSVVVSHAGSGTAISALDHGLPQLCLPQGADQFDNAIAIAQAGAGMSLMPDQVTGQAVREAVARLLGDDAFRVKAEELQAAIAGMPSPDEVCTVLEDLTPGAARIP